MERISELFLTICNMSVTAGFAILFVILVRGLLYKSPKAFSYYLWGIAGFRLICPYSFTTIFSLFNMRFFKETSTTGNTLTWVLPGTVRNLTGSQGTRDGTAQTAAKSAANAMKSTAESVSNGVAGKAITESSGRLSGINHPSGAFQQGPLNGLKNFFGSMSFMNILALIWVIGIAVFLIYQGIAYWKLKKKTEMAVQSGRGIYECDRIQVPFVMGIVHPRIFLPFRMTEKEREYILTHEQYHIKRHDHQIKFAATLILAVYWFHPLVWAAYHLMCKDMEMSCDEKVIQMMGSKVKEDYSRSLLGFAVKRRIPAASPLAFGEISVKARIKNVLSVQNHGKTAVAASMIICLIAGLIGCGNALPMDSIQNLSGDKASSEEGIRYRYEIGDNFQSFLIYKEMYRSGELKEYAVLQTGTFGKEQMERHGEVTVTRTFWHPGDAEWNAVFSCTFSGEELEVQDHTELLGQGYAGMAENYYMENETGREKIEPGDDIVIAAWHLAGNEGSVEGLPCTSYMDEQERRNALSKNDGEILYHIVFSDKTEEELLKEYETAPAARRLYDRKNEYIGDASADGKLLQELAVSSLGSFTMELQTSEEPYGITLHFEETPENELEFYRRMNKKAAAFLMLTQNAGSVEWTYPVKNEGKEETRRFVCDIERAEKLTGVSSLRLLADSEAGVECFLTDYLSEEYIRYENIEMWSNQYQAPDGRMYLYSTYVIGHENNEKYDKVYGILSNEENVTMKDVEEALAAGGSTEKVYVVKEITVREQEDNSQAEGYLAPSGDVYKYKMRIQGRHPNAAADSSYMVYADRADVTFEDVTMYIFGSTMPKEKMYILPLVDE